MRANNFDRADGLVAIAQDYVRGVHANRSPIEIVVTVPAETLRRDPARQTGPDLDADPLDPDTLPSLADGTGLSVHAARRLSCDAGIVEMIEDEAGNPLSVGRKTRSVPASIKRALLRRDDGCCQFPGCTNRVFVEAHHIEHWVDGGATELRNLLSACSFHHRFLHEYGYTVELHADGPHFFDAQGRRVHHVPPPQPVSNLGWDTIHARNAHLEITSEVNQCGWDGNPVNYDWAVHDLVVAAGLH